MLNSEKVLDILKSYWGVDGTANDRINAFLSIITGRKGPNQDLLKYRLIELGYSGNLNDMLYKFLGDQGYTGTLNERVRQATEIASEFIYPEATDTTLVLDFSKQIYQPSDRLCTYVPENEEGTTLYLAFDGDYYSESDYLCGDPVTLLLDFAIQYYVEKQPCI